MRILSVTSHNIVAAIRLLRRGGTVIFPTETSYGLGCDATNEKAVERVFFLKGRQKGKGLPVIVESFERAQAYGLFSEKALGLAQAHWPGALTLVLPTSKRRASDPRCVRQEPVAQGVLQNQEIAIRFSPHPVPRALATGLERPLVATSANRSGERACYSPEGVLAQFSALRGPLPDFFLDAGTLPFRPPSTVIRVVGERVEMVRQGDLTPRIRAV
jgi:L-threonylcarbamoyladenylate synthase